MTTLITGNFRQQIEAQKAVRDLAGAGFAAGLTSTFFVNPPGQHDLYPIGGDVDESPGTEDAGGGSISGAAVGGAIGVAVGLATLPVLGPGAAVAAAGVGAYGGSLYGALVNTDDKNTPTMQNGLEEYQRGDLIRKSGMLVAVAAPASAQQDTAIRILRAHGATDIEVPEGTIVAGEWTDFNPLTPLKLVTD
jgi:hypothetical protein